MLLAETGLAPITRRSGAGGRVRFRLAANHHLRDAFTWWAFNSLRARLGRGRATTRRVGAAPLLSCAARRRRMLGTGALALLAGLDALRAHSGAGAHGPVAPPAPAFALEGGRCIVPHRRLARTNLTWGVCRTHFLRSS